MVLITCLIEYLKRLPLFVWFRERLRPRTIREIQIARLDRWGCPPLPASWSDAQVDRYYVGVLVHQKRWQDVSEAEAAAAIRQFSQDQQDRVYELLMTDLNEYWIEQQLLRCW